MRQLFQSTIAVASNVLYLLAYLGARPAVPLHLNLGQQPRSSTRRAVRRGRVVRRVTAHAQQPVLSTDAACAAIVIHAVRTWCRAEILARPDRHVVAADVTVGTAWMRKKFVNLRPKG